MLPIDGAVAYALFKQAEEFVKEGRFAEALQVPMLPSDCAVIAAKIERAKALVNGAKGDNDEA